MREYATQAEGAYELSGKRANMAWDLSADREREQMESLRNAWLEREEVILNHFRVSAAMFRWGYRILGIIAALVAAIMLAVGLIERNLIVVLFGVVLI